MKTYFIAGYSVFAGMNDRWCFWRVVNWTDDDTPQKVINTFVQEFENCPDNFRHAPYGTGTIKGDVIITAFNQV